MIQLNRLQKIFLLLNPSSATFIGGRGIGKTTLIAFFFHKLQRVMPRSTWLYIAPSYKQLYQVILPNFLKALGMLGYINGYHYYLGKKPNRRLAFESPINELGDFSNVLIFKNGFTIRFVSLSKNATSQRGGDIDGFIVDEALDIDKEFVDNEVSPSNRGNNESYKGIPFHHGSYYFSSMPLDSKGDWLTKPSNYYNEDGIDFRALMNELIELQLLFVDTRNTQEMLELRKEINALRKQIVFHKSVKDYNSLGIETNHLHLEGNGFDNLGALGINYFRRERKRISSNTQYKREILNMLMKRVEGGFYSGLDLKIHGYKKDMEFDGLQLTGVNYKQVRYDTDYRGDLPLICGIDFGAHINFMTIGQRDYETNSIKIINNLYALKEDDEILNDLAVKFCDYYSTVLNKRLIMHYDASGNWSQINSRTNLAQDFALILIKRGWSVEHKTSMNLNSNHDDRYYMWERIFKLDPSLPRVTFNVYNCKELINSMQLAPVVDKGKISKNKNSEKDRAHSLEATHASDSGDYMIWGEVQEEYSNTGAGGGFNTVVRTG